MIRCWYYRRFIGRFLDTGSALSPAVHQHLNACPECRNFYYTGVQLVERLTSDAAGQRTPPSPFLHARIRASLNRPTPRPQITQVWRLAPALGAATVVLAALLLFRGSNPPSQNPAPAVVLSDDSSGSQLLTQAARWASRQKMLELSQSLDAPLEQELQFVVDDAKQAMRLLAANFLPGN